jgi:uncharacterized protein YciI
MQFLLIAFDGTDEGALERRMKARPSHFENVALSKKKGEFRLGGAILDEDGKMIGSMIVYEFPDREALNKYLENEPYIVSGTWKRIDIRPFNLASFDSH